MTLEHWFWALKITLCGRYLQKSSCNLAGSCPCCVLCIERESAMFYWESEVCGRGVVSYFNSTTLMKPKQQDQHKAGKNSSCSLFRGKSKVFRKKKWEKPPVNAPSFHLIFVQMLTPINRWHNVLLRSLFCIAFSKCWHLAVWITWENVCFCAYVNTLYAHYADPLDLVCVVVLSWNAFQQQQQGTTVNTNPVHKQV